MSDTPKAFAINANEGVTVHVDDSSADDQFALTVHDGVGNELESHTGLTAESIVSVTSQHFSAEHVEAPVPEEPSADDEAADED